MAGERVLRQRDATSRTGKAAAARDVTSESEDYVTSESESESSEAYV